MAMIISRAPFRISFFGGGTDFPEYFLEHGGAVLATAIDKFSYVTASGFPGALFDYNVRLSYSTGEMSKTVEDLRHPVFRECLRYCGLTKDIELHTVADLPSFSGIGSSSSFTVALLQALHAYKGEFRSALDLAYEAIHIERNVLNESVGLQDQTTAAVGGFNVIEFRSETDIRVCPLVMKPGRLEELRSHLFLVFTGITRRAAELEGEKLKRLSENRTTLLCMRKMVDAGHSLLSSGGGFEQFGRMLHDAWLAKRSLSGGVSNSSIDQLYAQGLASGAWGGKLLGAGRGGFLLFCCSPESRKALMNTFSERFQPEFRLGVPGAQILFAQT